jgi:hypothetical protein
VALLLSSSQHLLLLLLLLCVCVAVSLNTVYDASLTPSLPTPLQPPIPNGLVLVPPLLGSFQRPLLLQVCLVALATHA